MRLPEWFTVKILSNWFCFGAFSVRQLWNWWYEWMTNNRFLFFIARLVFSYCYKLDSVYKITKWAMKMPNWCRWRRYRLPKNIHKNKITFSPLRNRKLLRDLSFSMPSIVRDAERFARRVHIIRTRNRRRSIWNTRQAPPRHCEREKNV